MTIIDWTVAPRLERPETWTHQAACAETDPHMWFPDGWHEAPEAIRICHTCPVKDACLADALRAGELTDGIRGGLYPSERRQLALGQVAERDPNCRHCREPLDPGNRSIYHPDCHRLAKNMRQRSYRVGVIPPRQCLMCKGEVGARKMYCPDCARSRHNARVAANREKRLAEAARKKWRQCSWCGLNTKAKDGLHPDCKTKRARALDGLEVGQ